MECFRILNKYLSDDGRSEKYAEFERNSHLNIRIVSSVPLVPQVQGLPREKFLWQGVIQTNPLLIVLLRSFFVLQRFIIHNSFWITLKIYRLFFSCRYYFNFIFWRLSGIFLLDVHIKSRFRREWLHCPKIAFYSTKEN